LRFEALWFQNEATAQKYKKCWGVADGAMFSQIWYSSVNSPFRRWGCSIIPWKTNK